MAQNIITYPGGKAGFGLVKRLKLLDIQAFPISLGSHDEPELALIDGSLYTGFEAITKYLDDYQAEKLKTAIPGEP